MTTPTLTPADLVVRISNAEPHKFEANSFAALEDLDKVVKFRPDAGLWYAQSESDRVRVAVAAYEDLIKLTWSSFAGRSQSRDYGFGQRLGPVNEPPLEDAEFQWRVRKAQAIQALFILAGTQARDMARDGIRLTRNLTGSEVELTGYAGPVCVEAIEVLAPYLELQPRLRRF